MYGNTFDGSATNDVDTAQSLFQAYAGAHSIIVDSNTATDLRAGIVFEGQSTTEVEEGTASVPPIFFNMVKDTRITDVEETLVGISVNYRGGPELYGDTTYLGTIFRRNIFDGAPTGLSFRSDTNTPSIIGFILQDNVTTNTTTDTSFDPANIVSNVIQVGNSWQ